MFKLKLPQKEQGFTLVEVLIAILLATVFVAVAMQLMAIAALFKARAQEYAEATTWIQKDLENVKYQADSFQLPNTTLTATATKGASSINVASVPNFTPNVNDTLKVGLDPGTYKITGITGNTLNIAPQLGTDQLQNAAVLETTMCTNATQTTGLADALRDKITGITQTVPTSYVDIPKTSVFTNKQFTMRRTLTLFNATPYNMLQVNYSVSPALGGASIANFYIEVIPSAASQCQ